MQTTLHFSTPIPNKHDLLADIKKHFPDVKSKLSFNDFIDIKQKSVMTALDLSNKSIIINTDYNATNSKNMFIQILVGIIFFIPILYYLKINRTKFWPIFIALIPSALIRHWLRQRSIPFQEMLHQKVVIYLQEKWGGEE